MTLVAGAMQVNARIPVDTPAGDAPIVLKVGQSLSPARSARETYFHPKNNLVMYDATESWEGCGIDAGDS